MNDNTFWALVICMSIGSCTACTISERHINSQERIAMTPVQQCVRDAIFQSDKIKCLQAAEAKP